MAITISILLFLGAFFIVYNNSYRMISGSAFSVYSIENGMAVEYGNTAYLLKYDPAPVEQLEEAIGKTPSLLPLPAQLLVLLTELAKTVASFLPQ